MSVALGCWVLPHFASLEGMFSLRQKVDCILWLAELKSYTCVRHKFNQVYPNQTSTDLQICDVFV
jgi:hypothetical protein